VGRRDEAIRVVLEHPLPGEAARNLGVSSERSELRREDEASRTLGVVEGLLTETVPGENQRVATPVHQGEGPHAVEAFEQRGPPLAPAVQQDLGIGV
jgi:hypothetical protein